MKHQTVEGRKYIEWGDVQRNYAYGKPAFYKKRG